jgi:hypothetical protein
LTDSLPLVGSPALELAAIRKLPPEERPRKQAVSRPPEETFITQTQKGVPKAESDAEIQDDS